MTRISKTRRAEPSFVRSWGWKGSSPKQRARAMVRLLFEAEEFAKSEEQRLLDLERDRLEQENWQVCETWGDSF